MKLLEGKNALIFGIANDHSIAWGIARALHEHGANLAFSYAAPSLERRVRPLGAWAHGPRPRALRLSLPSTRPSHPSPRG